EHEDALVGDRVVGEVAAPAPPHDSSPFEHAEVLGDVLFCCPDRRGELEHARLALAKPVEQLDPGRLAQHPEALRDQLDQVVGERVLNHHVAYTSSSSHGSSRPGGRRTSAAALIAAADNY